MSDHAANEGFADPERVKFINEFKEFCMTTDILGYRVTPVAWAFLWTTPLDELKNRQMKNLAYELANLEKRSIVSLWQQKKKKDDEFMWSSPSDHATPSLVHSSPLMTISPLQPAGGSMPPPPRPDQAFVASSPLMTMPPQTAGEVMPPPSRPGQEPTTPAPRKRQKRTVSEADLSSVGSPATLASRSQHSVQQTLHRDKFRCVISGLKASTDVAHIYPHSMQRDGRLRKSVQQFWLTLMSFRPQNEYEAWYKSVFPKGIDVPSNMLTLQPTLHSLWSKAAFALKPISLSEDGQTLRVQFWWMKAQPRSESVDMTEVPDLSEDPAEPILIAVAQPPNFTESRELRSGTQFLWTTDDATARPLPSIAVLELQWHLQRIACMAAASEESESDSDDNDDEAVFDPLEGLLEEDERRQAGLELTGTGKLPIRAANPGIQPFIM